MRDRIPRASIRWIVDRLSVGTSDADVEADIRRRAAQHAGWTPAETDAAVRYALRCHAANRRLYRFVAAGR